MLITSNHQTMLPRCTASTMVHSYYVLLLLCCIISPILLVSSFLFGWAACSNFRVCCVAFMMTTLAQWVSWLFPLADCTGLHLEAQDRTFWAHCRGIAIQQGLIPIWAFCRRVPALLGVVLSLPVEWTLHKQHMCTWLSIILEKTRHKALEFPSILGLGCGSDCSSYICFQQEAAGREQRVQYFSSFHSIWGVNHHHSRA